MLLPVGVQWELPALAAEILGAGHVPDSLAIVAVQGEGDTHDVSVPAGDVESV
jgi:hypothetical protein